MVETVSAAQARRIALAAQGFGQPPPVAVGTRQLNLLIGRLGLLQIDSVNVFERSHYLPVFARLGAYSKADLDRLTLSTKARYTEYWAHEAALIPAESRGLWRWKMDAARARDEADNGSWIHANRAMLDWLVAELRSKGPLPASKIEHDANKRKGGWWGWSDVKNGLEYLFRWGDVVSAGRQNFERIYALPEQVFSTDQLNARAPHDDAVRQLVHHAARALGIGTLSDLADYYRLKTAQTRAAVTDLLDAGEIRPVEVRGWKQPAYLHRDARLPRRINAVALLSPFDPVVWNRDRALRMFDFHYRIEIYTPAHKRIYGYYTLPILLDDQLVGRIDLKSDRQAGILRVQSAWSEPHAPTDTAERIAPLLQRTAKWQGLDGVQVVDRGDLAPALSRFF